MTDVVVLTIVEPTVVISEPQGVQGIPGPQGIVGSQGPAGDAVVLLFTSDGTLSQQIMDSFPSEGYGGAKYLVYATEGSTRQICELMVLHDGVNVNIVEYANIFTSSVLCTFDGNILGANVNIMITPSTTWTNFRISRTLLPS